MPGSTYPVKGLESSIRDSTIDILAENAPGRTTQFRVTLRRIALLEGRE